MGLQDIIGWKGPTLIYPSDYIIHIISFCNTVNIFSFCSFFRSYNCYLPGIILNGEKIVATKKLLSSSCTLSLYHLHLIFIGILLTFSPMHFLGFNVMPRRIPSFPDSFHSWNSLSSIGSGITFLSFSTNGGAYK